jgi:hypothetical protein
MDIFTKYSAQRNDPAGLRGHKHPPRYADGSEKHGRYFTQQRAFWIRNGSAARSEPSGRRRDHFEKLPEQYRSKRPKGGKHRFCNGKCPEKWQMDAIWHRLGTKKREKREAMTW